MEDAEIRGQRGGKQQSSRILPQEQACRWGTSGFLVLPCLLEQPPPQVLVSGAPSVLSRRIPMAAQGCPALPGQDISKALQRTDVAQGTFAATLLHLAPEGSTPVCVGCFIMVMGWAMRTQLGGSGESDAM